MDLSIVIVNYKSAELVLQCLRTVYSETSRIKFEVIVVDNNSGDDSESQVRSAFSDVQWIQMGYNSGFARANNAGIKRAGGESVLLLNADTLVRDRAIERCYLAFQPSIYAACGVQLLNSDGTPQIAGNFVMKGGLNYLLPLPYLGSFFKWLGVTLSVKKPNVENTDTTTKVDWINGAFLMVRQAAIAEAGLLDEDFFLYAEEAEWCGRIKRTGELCIFGEFKVVHLQGETSNATFGSTGKGYYNLFDRKGLQIMVSNFLRIRKQFGVPWLLIQLFFYLADIPVFAIGLIISKILGRSKFSINQLAGYVQNVCLLVRYVPSMISGRPYFYKVL